MVMELMVLLFLLVLLMLFVAVSVNILAPNSCFDLLQVGCESINLALAGSGDRMIIPPI